MNAMHFLPFLPQRNHFLMLPWVVLGFMLIISLVISVIYTTVMFFIDGYILAGVIWLIGGIICCCEYQHPTIDILYIWISSSNTSFIHILYCSDIPVHVGRGVQPFHRNQGRTTTRQIQPSTISQINDVDRRPPSLSHITFNDFSFPSIAFDA